MFGAPRPRGQVGPADVDERLRELGGRLPDQLRLGTSSWSFPGWRGIVYDRDASTRTLAQGGLRAYAQHPLFKTVGVDRTFYAPVGAEVLADYASQVPPGFRFLVKAHGACSLARFGHDPRHGDRAGTLNERFLDASYARDEVVRPFVEGLGSKAGVLLFQFPPQALAPLGGAKGLPDRLYEFFSALPKLEQGHYAVEVRNPELFTRRYVQALEAAGVQHCLNALPKMQPLPVQFDATGGRERRALVLRWMLHRSHDYQGAKLAYAPFDRIVDDDEGTRADIAKILASSVLSTQSHEAPVPTYVIVNNKAEGSSPLSILRLVEHLFGAG